MPFAVLQRSLEQPLDREKLADALARTGSLTRYDSFRLHKELFGIVARDLSRGDAEALQRALAECEYSTDVVDQADLPRIPDVTAPLAIRFGSDGIVFSDFYGRDLLRPWSQLSFACAGHLLRLRDTPTKRMEWNIQPGPRGSIRREVILADARRLENQNEFRLEFFFASEPPRVQSVLTDETFLRVDDRVIRLHNVEKLAGVLRFLATALPATHTNLGIRHAGDAEPFVYPSVAAFEEEIVWSLYRRQPR